MPKPAKCVLSQPKAAAATELPGRSRTVYRRARAVREHDPLSLAGRTRLDRPRLAGTGDFDAARLGLLGDRKRHREHAVIVGCADVVGIDIVAEAELAHVGAGEALGRNPLDAFIARQAALRAQGEGAVVDAHIHCAGVNTWQIGIEYVVVACLEQIHRHESWRACRPDGFAEQLAGNGVDVMEWIEPEHSNHLHFTKATPATATGAGSCALSKLALSS